MQKCDMIAFSISLLDLRDTQHLPHQRGCTSLHLAPLSIVWSHLLLTSLSVYGIIWRITAESWRLFLWRTIILVLE